MNENLYIVESDCFGCKKIDDEFGKIEEFFNVEKGIVVMFSF